jgi:hypothetical protein
MSAQARRERAYRHYVQKQIKQRQREAARAQKAANRQTKEKMKLAQPSEPQVAATVESVPNSWSEPMPEEVAAPQALSSDEVVPPVTVSASDSIMATQNPDKPSPP